MEVRGTNLKMTRGDSEYLLIFCPKRPFTDGDEILFTVKKTVYTREIELQKKAEILEDGKAYIEILPEDTSCLDYGIYKYDVQLITPEGVVTTIVKPSGFNLTEEVTWND